MYYLCRGGLEGIIRLLGGYNEWGFEGYGSSQDREEEVVSLTKEYQ